MTHNEFSYPAEHNNYGPKAVYAIIVFVISALLGFFAYQAAAGISELKSALDKHIQEHVNDAELRDALNRHLLDHAADHDVIETLQHEMATAQQDILKLLKRKPTSTRELTNYLNWLNSRLDVLEEHRLK